MNAVNARRRIACLQALGIDVWVRRRPLAAAEAQSLEEAAAAPLEVPPATQFEPASVSLVEPRAIEPVLLAPAATPVPDAEEQAALWQALEAEVAKCTRCGLHATRTQTVFGVGDRRARWLVIGEAPGAEEDRRGEPFVGRAGQLLDAMLRAIGLARGADVYVANILKCRPPNNRDPRPDEVSCCLPYLARQIALIQPRIILAVGRIAAQNLLATDAPLSRLRGRVHRFGTLNTPVVVTYHPAYLLCSPAEKRRAWEDLKFARSVFSELAS